MNRLANIEAFIKVTESGSITAAAEQLNVGKSAVSRRIAELEDSLGTRLLSRTTRKISLTEPGERFFRRCQQLLLELDEAEAVAAAGQQTLSGALRVAAPLSFGLLFLHRVVAKFSQLHPAVILDIELNDRYVNLIEEGFDMAIRIGELADSNLVAKQLSRIDHVICASPEFWRQHGVPQSPYDLQSLPCLHYSYKQSDRITLLDEQGTPHAIKLNLKLRGNNGDFMREIAKQGLGYVITPRFIVHKELAENSLISVLHNCHYRNMTLNAVYPSRRFKSAKVTALTQLLIDHFATDSQWSNRKGIA